MGEESSRSSPAEKVELIDLEKEEESSEYEYDDDDDRVKQDFYEDFDELADLAVTAACSEPPPPGTRPLQEELLTLITENTVSGVTINKDDVVAWLRNEDAVLTGESSQIVPNRFYPSPPSSHEKYSDSELSDNSRSARSPPKKKSKSLNSIAVRRDKHERSNGESSRHRESARHCEGSREGSRQRSRDSPRRAHRSQHRVQSHDVSPVPRHRARASPQRHRQMSAARADKRRQPSPYGAVRRHSSPYGAVRRQPSPRGAVHRQPSPHSAVRRQSSSYGAVRRQPSSHVAARRQLSPRRLASPRYEDVGCRRRVKIQHRIVDEDNDTPQYHNTEVSSTKPRRCPLPPSNKLGGIRDARELLSDRRTSVPVTHYIKTLKEQMRSSEINAREMFKELQSAKKNLLAYLQTAERSESDETSRQRGDGPRREEWRRDERRRQGEKTRDRLHDERREETREKRTSQDRKRSRERKRPSPERKSKPKRSSTSPEKGSDNPSKWKIIPPSEVDGFNCGGPAIFVQNFSKSVSRKTLFTYFQSFGTIMDIKKLGIGKKRIRSACVIFCRQSEADKVLQSNRRERDSPVHIDMPTPPSTFDLLLNALKSDQPSGNIAVVQ